MTKQQKLEQLRALIDDLEFRSAVQRIHEAGEVDDQLRAAYALLKEYEDEDAACRDDGVVLKLPSTGLGGIGADYSVRPGKRGPPPCR